MGKDVGSRQINRVTVVGGVQCTIHLRRVRTQLNLKDIVDGISVEVIVGIVDKRIQSKCHFIAVIHAIAIGVGI